MTTKGIDDVVRAHAPHVLAAVVRKYGDFASSEDAVQEALLAAAEQWPAEGLPDNPRAWLITVASRRRIAMLRSDSARRRREEAVAEMTRVDTEPAPAVDDTLTLFFLCCHPALTRHSQVALTLRAVGGLTTAEIARAFLVPESTIAQRIGRAKQRIKTTGAEFSMPSQDELPARVTAVLEVLYLIFNEGYTASSGPELHRVELADEAVRLARQVHEQLPEDGEVSGLLALMLLTNARRPARLDPDGALVPLAEQDRSRWNGDAIDEGLTLIARALATAPVGPYQLQAAIAAVHDEAARAEDTDWPQILALYDHLQALAPGPMVMLNRAVAVAMVRGPAAGLVELDQAGAEPALAGHHRLDAIRAHLLELAGDMDGARRYYQSAAGRTLSGPEQRYLEARAALLR